MQLQVYSSSLLFARVEVEIRLCTEGGSLIREKEINFDLIALDANTLFPVQFRIDGEVWDDSASLLIGQSGYVKSEISFDSKDTKSREIIFRAIIDDQSYSQRIFDSPAVKLIKYRVELNDVRLTDDITNYDGDENIHYTNNDSARIKVLYNVYDEDGILADPSDLSYFQSEVQSHFLFANGDRVQCENEAGLLVDITEIDCAVKRKHKEEVKIRVSKKVFEERKSELKIIDRDGVIAVSYRLNMFSSHQKLKQCNLAGRKYTIELSHPLALSTSVPSFKLLTKYHRVKKEKDSFIKEEAYIKKEKIPIQTHKERIYVKEEKVFIKKEKHEEAQVHERNTENMKADIKPLVVSHSHDPSGHSPPSHHNFPFPSSLNTQPSPPTSFHSLPSPSSFHFPPSSVKVKQEMQQKQQLKQQPLTVTHEQCIQAARRFVDVFLTQPTLKGCASRKTACYKKTTKTFKKATYAKQDSSFRLKKPFIIKQKKTKKKNVIIPCDKTRKMMLISDEELLILSNFLSHSSNYSSSTKTSDSDVDVPAETLSHSPFSPAAQDDVQKGLDGMEGFQFHQNPWQDQDQDGRSSMSSMSSSMMLAVAEVSDKDIEPFLDPQELFVNFDLFA